MAKVTSKTERIIGRYRAELARMGIRVAGVFLYGSRVRGADRSGSDVDLVVISEDFGKMGLLQRLETLGLAAARIGEAVQAYGFTPEEIDSDSMPPFLSEVLKHEAVAV